VIIFFAFNQCRPDLRFVSEYSHNLGFELRSACRRTRASFICSTIFLIRCSPTLQRSPFGHHYPLTDNLRQ
jgi:hypothetical protein